MIYTIKVGDTLNSIATALTIGGADYGVAIGNYNGISSLANFPAGNTLDIPDEWIIGYVPPATAGGGAPSTTTTVTTSTMPAPKSSKIFGLEPTTVMIAGAGLLALLVIMSGKRR